MNKSKKGMFIGILGFFIFVISINIYFIEECTSWACSVSHTTDLEGEHMIDYKNYAGLGIGKVYNPNFIENVEWFEENYEDHGSYYLVPYNYDWLLTTRITFTPYTDKVERVSAPFYSCEGQGKAIVLNILAHEETNEQIYLDNAYKYYYGITNTFLTENYWLQGFYHKDFGGTYILNSQMYCLSNIYHFYEYTKDPEIKLFFDNGVKRLEQDIDDYTAINGTIYDKYTYKFKPHKDHPDYSNLVKWFYETTNSTKLERVYNEWNPLTINAST